jgi:hypothetical protein
MNTQFLEFKNSLPITDHSRSTSKNSKIIVAAGGHHCRFIISMGTKAGIYNDY